MIVSRQRVRRLALHLEPADRDPARRHVHATWSTTRIRPSPRCPRCSSASPSPPSGSPTASSASAACSCSTALMARAVVELVGLHPRLRRRARRGRPRPRRLRGRAALAPRPLRLRQDDDAQPDRGLRGAERRARPHRRRGRDGARRPTSAGSAWCSSPMRSSRTCRSSRTWPSGCASAASPAAEIARRVGEALALVRLERAGRAAAAPALGRHAAARRPGARPRVRAARAAARRAARRAGQEAARGDARRSCARSSATVGITTIFVTHDQAEALSLSDRIAVMNAGGSSSSGAPREIYERPASALRRRLHRRVEPAARARESPPIGSRSVRDLTVEVRLGRALQRRRGGRARHPAGARGGDGAGRGGRRPAPIGWRAGSPGSRTSARTWRWRWRSRARSPCSPSLSNPSPSPLAVGDEVALAVAPDAFLLL